MAVKGRSLQSGDFALTDFNGRGMTRVRIVNRKEKTISQSGVMFQVAPPLKNNQPDAWTDADWFEPVPA